MVAALSRLARDGGAQFYIVPVLSDGRRSGTINRMNAEGSAEQ
jgi:hypothetical protein